MLKNGFITILRGHIMSDYYISKITPFTKTIKGKKVKVFKFLYKGKGQTKYLRKSSKSKTELQIITLLRLVIIKICLPN